jgi:hypothetical protein
VGDSKNTIRYFVLGSAPKDAKLQRIIERTKLLLTTSQAQFFHILRENNREVDGMENREIGMAPGSLRVQGCVIFDTPLMEGV